MGAAVQGRKSRGGGRPPAAPYPGLMDRTRRARIFGEVAEVYDRVRPPYPDTLVDQILQRVPGAGSATMVEVGAGTGKASRQFLDRGVTVVAVEPDPRMAAVAAARLGETGRFHIHVAAFEEWEGEGGPYDLVVAAQAWHWIDPDVGFRRAWELLGADGLLALLWNRPRRGGRPEGIDEAYRRHAPHLAGASTLDRSWRPDGRSRDVAGSGLFTEPEVLTHRWSRWYTTDDYVDLLRTQSDHRILPPEALTALIGDIREALAADGGVEISYLSEALVARPRPVRPC